MPATNEKKQPRHLRNRQAGAKLCGICGNDTDLLGLCKDCFLCYECAKDPAFQTACRDRTAASPTCFLCDVAPIHPNLLPLETLLQAFKETFVIKARRQRKLPSIALQIPTALKRKSKDTVRGAKHNKKNAAVTKQKGSGRHKAKSAAGEEAAKKESGELFCGLDLDKIDLEEYYAQHPLNISKEVKIPGHAVRESPLWKHLKRSKPSRKGQKGVTKSLLGDVTKALISWYGIKPSKPPAQAVEDVFVDLLFKSYGGEGPVGDHIRALFRAVQSASIDPEASSGKQPRVHFFAAVVGLIDSKYYTPDASTLLFEILHRVLGPADVLTEVLDSSNQYLPFVKVDVCECAVFTLFKKSQLWKLAHLDDVCQRFKVKPAWADKDRAYFMDKVEELEQVVKSLQGVNPALKSEQSIIDLDRYLFLLMQHWFEERQRIISQVENGMLSKE